MTIGKTRGLARLADGDGHFTMVALDQRPPLFAAIAAARGIAPEAVAFADVAAAKRLLVRALGSHASSMLLDPNYAVPAAIDVLPPRAGLIVTLEDHRVEDGPDGRRSRAIADWSVAKIRRMGGDAVKVLAWYRPDAAPGVIAHQQAFVRGIGEDCRRHDIPYVLELLVYPFAGRTDAAAVYDESPDKKAELVIESVREFAKPGYGVDLLKLESPLPVAILPAPGDDGAAAAQARFDELGAICRDAGLPWVLLSAGTTPERFAAVLTYAYAAGAQGFLAGRTIWLDAVRGHFPDGAAVLAALEGESVRRLQALAALTRDKAAPWTPRYALPPTTRDGDFAAGYGADS